MILRRQKARVIDKQMVAVEYIDWCLQRPALNMCNTDSFITSCGGQVARDSDKTLFTFTICIPFTKHLAENVEPP